MALDRAGLPVSDFARSERFYGEALAPLGYRLVAEVAGSAAGFGRDERPDFWIASGEAGSGAHLAFASPDRSTVDAFYAALAAGGKDDGSSGLGLRYHPGYYGAFILDPDGHDVGTVRRD